MKKHLFSLCTILLLIGILPAGNSMNTITVNAASASSAETSQTTSKQKSKTTKVTISAAGDCTLGVDSRYNTSFNTYYANHNAAYFFKKVKPIFSKDDITIVNFEGTLTESTNRASKKFTFKGPAKYTSILKKGSIEVVNLANNHTMDFGKSAFNDTKKALKKAKISYCHYGTIAYKTVNHVKIAFLGFHQTSLRQVKDGIRQAKKKKAKIIIVSFHWGIEKSYYPNSTQKSLGHYAIDHGAALVLGHHPHVLQGIEKYKGRYIVYSLGNFCFGGNNNPTDKDTMIFQQTFYLKNGRLQKKNDARIIPCSLSSVSYTNDFQPKKLAGNSKKKLIDKVNNLSKGMHTSVKSNGKLK